VNADAVIVSLERAIASWKERNNFTSGENHSVTLDQFETCPLIGSILLVVGQEDMDFC
jgi:hypothetical protein